VVPVAAMGVPLNSGVRMERVECSRSAHANLLLSLILAFATVVSFAKNKTKASFGSSLSCLIKGLMNVIMTVMEVL